jgi:predicted AAA+ superfamily ATPase
MRNDKGVLWENYLVNERLKFLTYSRISANRYFWRTQQQQEIDYIEERDSILHTYEFKWKAKPGLRVPPAFSKAYPEQTFRAVTPGDFDSFLTQI